MEEIEVPTDHLHEAINEKAEEHLHQTNKISGWLFYVAISTALMAVFAAVSSLNAGHHSNEALIDQIRASDQWSFYQAKGIKAEIKKMSVNNDPANKDDIERYKKEQEEIKVKADDLQKSSASNLEIEKKFAKAVTFFQIAIAMSAISILSQKKALWVVSLGIGLIGIYFLIDGFLTHQM